MQTLNYIDCSKLNITASCTVNELFVNVLHIFALNTEQLYIHNKKDSMSVRTCSYYNRNGAPLINTWA